MNNKIITALFVALLGITHSYASDCSMQNLDAVKKDLIRYHDDGQYERDQAAVAGQALGYLKERITKATPNEKLAIVLDIDETSLSNYRDMADMRFGGNNDQINGAEAKGTDAAIKPTLELYRYAKAHHVAVFFITGRPERFRALTEDNLLREGYKNWDGLILKPDDYRLKSIVPYKASSRRALSKNNYIIVVNMGDQLSDLAGGYSEKSFKLPNPYYFLP
ncbi:MAG: HAD family acid phosphatase [Gammaproteobacteria bacterium]|nr:HAD family acid phosphatase [Gammaproteobacteria bacterium]